MMRARHRASKLSESLGANACESKGSLRVSVTLIGVASVFGWTESCAGHCNNDFEIVVLPSYQHFRPSIRRQDHQCPCGFDGIATLHCFACAVGAPISKTVAMQAAKATGRMWFVIRHLTRNYLWTVASLSNLVTKGRKFGHIPSDRPRCAPRKCPLCHLPDFS